MSAATDAAKARLLRRRNTDRGVPRELYLEERVHRLESELDELYKLKRLKVTAGLASAAMLSVKHTLSISVNSERSAQGYAAFSAAQEALALVLEELNK